MNVAFGPYRRSGAWRGYGVRLGLWLCGALVFCGSGVAEPSTSARPLRLVAFGDSLTAGYNLPQGDGFVAQLQSALRKDGYKVNVIDGGVSGDTTSDGLSRLDWTLADGADGVILELGANDMLRGVAPRLVDANLREILAKLKAKHIPVLLAGMRAMPNLGKDYVQSFDAIYPRLAQTYRVPLYPFFLEGIMGDASQHLSDGMHPNARGVATIVSHILPSVENLLKTISSSG